MSTVGIIAEYNPFHNGHQYHLLKSKELSGAEFSVAIMSGNFLQRGEPAIFNKWTRSQMALCAGIDLVIELPFVFASQDARGFALAGIRLLNNLGVIDYVSFGCEENQIEILSELAKIIAIDPPYLKKIYKEELKKGISFPKIREEAMIRYYEKYEKNFSMNKIKEILKKPNNILALEYLRSLQETRSPIKPIAIKRVGSGYLEEDMEGSYSSATAIRKQIVHNYLQNNNETLDEIRQAIPIFSYHVISNELKNGINPIQLSSYEQSILVQLRKMPIAELRSIHGVQEGLENRMKEIANASYSIENFIESTKTKRYTRTRIQRLLIHTLFNLHKSEVILFNKQGPLYCRVLGMTENGKTLLKKIKKSSKIPIVINVKNLHKQYQTEGYNLLQKMLSYDILSTDLYSLGYHKKSLRIGRQDFTRKILIQTENQIE